MWVPLNLILFLRSYPRERKRDESFVCELIRGRKGECEIVVELKTEMFSVCCIRGSITCKVGIHSKRCASYMCDFF